MKIAVLAHNLHTGGGLSIGKDIIGTLPRIAPMHRYLMIIPRGKDYPDLAENDQVELLESPISWRKRFLWERKNLYQAIERFSPDWLWTIGNIPLKCSGVRQSLFMQNSHLLNYTPDWIWQSSGNLFSFGGSWCRYHFRKKIIAHCIQRAVGDLQHVYCQTETICRRFVDCYHCDPAKMRVFRTPFSPGLKRLDSDAPVDPKIIPQAIQDKYASHFKLFYPSLPFPHKNMERIVWMYKCYREELASTVCILPVDPEGGPKERRLVQLIRRYGVEDLFWLTGHIAADSIAQYYHFSDAVFFPSLLETLGLGHLEGMYCDRPVIASDLDFARDVCGDVVYYVDPYSASSMKDGILALQQDPELRKRLVEKGKSRFQSWLGNWDDTIRDVLDQEEIEHL